MDDNCYDIVNQVIRGNSAYFFDPFPDYNAVSLKLNTLQIENKELFELLLLGNKVSCNKLIELFGESFIECVTELGIAFKVEDYLLTDNYIIVSYLNKYFLVNTPFRNPNCKIKDGDVYLGFDSYRLANNIIKSKVGSVLDLCTGSGIQGICANPYTEKVVGVELNEESCKIAKFNCILNDAESKVEIRNGNLYEAVGNQKFDIIYSNPPFIPVPNNLDFPICGNGGEDGLEIVTQIIEGYKEHLNEDGYGVIAGECLGNEKGPFLKGLVEKILGKGYESKINLTTKNTAECQISRTLDLAINVYNIRCNRDEIFQKWLSQYNKMNATSYYAFMLRVKKIAGGSGKTEVVNLTHSWDIHSIPQLQQKIDTLKLNTIYAITKNGKIISSVNQNTLEILQAIDNKKTIEEIYETLCKSDNPKIIMRHREDVIDDIINLCYLMQQSNVIDKKA